MPRRPGLNLSWNGSAWSVVTTLELSNDAAIAALSPTDVYVAQLGGLSHYNASAWTTTSIRAVLTCSQPTLLFLPAMSGSLATTSRRTPLRRRRC